MREKSGTWNLGQWDHVDTRVIPLRDGAVISGTLLAFDPEASEQLLTSLCGIRGKAGSLAAELAQDLGRAVSVKAVETVLTPNLLLGQTAFVFTNVWLTTVLRSRLDEATPVVTNSDGEPMELVTLHFPLRFETTLVAVRAALAAVPALRQAGPSFWNWLAPPGKPAKRAARGQAWPRLITTMEDGTVVLGTIEIGGHKMVLSVNSEGRAERGRVLLERALEGLVRPPLVERQDLNQVLAEQRAGGKGSPSPDIPPEEARAIVRQHLEEHYRAVLDQPIPALGDLSPRRAARTAKGRERVMT